MFALGKFLETFLMAATTGFRRNGLKFIDVVRGLMATFVAVTAADSTQSSAATIGLMRAKMAVRRTALEAICIA
jgi:hypothetical protein